MDTRGPNEERKYQLKELDGLKPTVKSKSVLNTKETFKSLCAFIFFHSEIITSTTKRCVGNTAAYRKFHSKKLTENEKDLILGNKSEKNAIRSASAD